MSEHFFYFRSSDAQGLHHYCVVYDKKKFVNPENKLCYKMGVHNHVDELVKHYGETNVHLWHDSVNHVHVCEVDFDTISLKPARSVFPALACEWRWISHEKFIQLCDEGAFRGIDSFRWFDRQCANPWVDAFDGTLAYKNDCTLDRAKREEISSAKKLKEMLKY